jgi:hypothetical protein
MVSITETDSVYCAVRSEYVCVTDVTPSKPSGYHMYHQFNIQQFYVLITQFIYVFYVDLGTNSDYFYSIN